MTSAAQHSFLGLTKCPLNVPVHALGLGVVACSLCLSVKAFSKIQSKKEGVKMPLAFDFFGRPAIYVHPCIGAAFYPTLILLQSGVECGYGMFREATANAKKEISNCPLTVRDRFFVQMLFGTSLITLFAQGVATRIVADKKTPDEAEIDNLHAAAKQPYALAKWKIVVPLVIAFLPTAAAYTCKYLHKK